MQPSESLWDNWVDELEKEILFAHDPDTMDAERIQDISKSKYCPVELTKIVTEGTHLEPTEQRQLLRLQQKYKDLFDGTLGIWKNDPIELELKNSNGQALSHKDHTLCHIPKRRS